jgi:hypothetical protein
MTPRLAECMILMFDFQSEFSMSLSISNGSVKCFGVNGSGQLGIENDNDIGDEEGEMVIILVRSTLFSLTTCLPMVQTYLIWLKKQQFNCSRH